MHKQNGNFICNNDQRRNEAELRLERLVAATTLKDIAALPGNRLEALKGSRQGQYIIRISDIPASILPKS